jgi:hypothetical protein
VGSFIIQRFIDLFMDTKRPPRTWNSCPDNFCWEPCVHHKGFAVGFTKVAFDLS